MKISTSILIVVSSFWAYPQCYSQFDSSSTGWNESESEYHARMKWWDDARLGMFLHWGIYSMYGGEYNGTDYGKEVGNASAEWIYLRANIPREEYRKTALAFNPVLYDPADWVKMAMDAGMKYMVLTAKHHDGFALFETRASEWDIIDASEYKKDLIKAYVDECHKQGMKVGFYYSHEKDWFHHAKNMRDRRPLSQDYIKLAETQLRELLTRYGKIDILWFDTPVNEHVEFNRLCAALVRKYQPECIISGRIGNNLGDYQNFGDRQVIDPGKEGYLESIMTMRLNWGYDQNDSYWKSSDELISMVSKSACRGSNFLLNIGPKPDGSFPPEDRTRLKALGKWIKDNGEAIYTTQGSPFSKEHSWGSFTYSQEKQKVFLHLFGWTGGDICINGIKTRITKAYFLDDGGTVGFDQDVANSKININLPADSRNGKLRIIALDLSGNLDTDPVNGPDYVPPRIHHLNRIKIVGTIKTHENCEFEFVGKIVSTNDTGFEIDQEEEKTVKLSLNDYVRYRINEKGIIRRVSGFDLIDGE
ncbi:MAG: alpha-L-fucosidase, partial [Bacteroidota bacterium]